MRLAILGAGAWGTAFALAQHGSHRTVLWTWQQAHCEAMRAARTNDFLPGHRLPDDMLVEHALPAALAGTDLVIIATPTAALRSTLQAIAAAGSTAPILWLCKGFEPVTARFPHQVAEEVLPSAIRRGAVSGPSFAEEIARGLPAAVTLASTDPEFADETARQLHSPRLRIYSTDDVPGVEVGGAVKNVMAIAAGICDGLGFGLSARAALMTRGLAEITRLGLKMGGRTETFLGLSGAGDLILTCTGDLSRNRRVGLGLAKGDTLPKILADLGHVAEGVGTAREARRLAAAHGVEMPITEAVCRLLDGEIGAREAADQLLRRDQKSEIQG